MAIPSYQEFLSLAKQGDLLPLSKTISADLLTPMGAYMRLAAGEPYSFLLESVEGGEQIGRYTFLGAKPYMIMTSRGGKVTIRRMEKGGREKIVEGNGFDQLGEILAGGRMVTVPGLPPFTAGAVGYFSYDAVRQLERIPEKSKNDLKMPECLLMFYDRLIGFDHVRQELHLIATADVRGGPQRSAYYRAVEAIEEMEGRLGTGVPPPKAEMRSGKLKIRESSGEKKYVKSVKRLKEHIAAGDIFQAVLSERLEFEPEVTPLAVYRALRRVNPSPYMYLLNMGNSQVLGSSPEMLVKVRGRRIQYRPIAGTRWRGRDEAEDQRLEAELKADEKERAEHVMLVDLGRNDVGRVSEYGSVAVKSLMQVERYSHVMHLVSAIEGKLRAGLSAMDAFKACFPAGTLTGAPKVRAMQILEGLEPVRRGVYGGAILYADFAGNLDSCIAIRTMVMEGKRAYVQAGAGIVADSDPASEYMESRNKARALVRAVELARGGE